MDIILDVALMILVPIFIIAVVCELAKKCVGLVFKLIGRILAFIFAPIKWVFTKLFGFLM